MTGSSHSMRHRVHVKWPVAVTSNSASTASMRPTTRPETLIGPSTRESPKSRRAGDVPPLNGRSFPGDPIRSPTGTTSSCLISERDVGGLGTRFVQLVTRILDLVEDLVENQLETLELSLDLVFGLEPETARLPFGSSHQDVRLFHRLGHDVRVRDQTVGFLPGTIDDLASLLIGACDECLALTDHPPRSPLLVR